MTEHSFDGKTSRTPDLEGKQQNQGRCLVCVWAAELVVVLDTELGETGQRQQGQLGEGGGRHRHRIPVPTATPLG